MLISKKTSDVKYKTTPPATDHSLMEMVRTVLVAGIIAIGIRTFLFEPFNIPSGSMVPTLLVGDFLFVSKYSYGYSGKGTFYGLPTFQGRLMGGAVQRGDVAVFKLPTDNSTDYIKRVIGLPGDRIQVIGGVLHINGEPCVRRAVGPMIVDEGRTGRIITAIEYIETLPGGREHRILEESDEGPLDNTPLYVVPAGHYFMMGDNRDNSQDSRVTSMVGFVPEENIVGRAELLFFSLDQNARFYEFWRWPSSIRFERIFDGIS